MLRPGLKRAYQVRVMRRSGDRGKILSALEKIDNLQKKINQKSQVTRIFFDTKYLEIAELFVGYSDPTVFTRLAQIDAAHQQIGRAHV